MANMNPGEKLSDRYEVIRELGRGGAGITYLARDTTTGRDVVAKLLHIGLLGDWKAVEMFEREAAVLKHLHHGQIPAYVDFFPVDLEGAPRFALVREFVDGQSLQALVDEGWRGTEEQIRDIGVRLVSVVAYIHSLRPPVVHRDINPRNVIVRADGEVFLLDFGGVQDAIRLSSGATATIVGTPGYTPMEQFVGRATVRSDLYAVAATLLFLLTHRNPVDLPVKDMKIDFAACIDISTPGLASVLSRWLEPDEGKRTLTVADAIALLEETVPRPAPSVSENASQPEHPSPAGSGSPHPPDGSRTKMTVENGTARFLVPDAGSRMGRRGRSPLGIFWLAVAGFWIAQSTVLHGSLTTLLYTLPIWAVGISVLVRVFSRRFGALEIGINKEGLTYSWKLPLFKRRHTVPLESIGECRIEGGWDSSTGAWNRRFPLSDSGFGFGDGPWDRQIMRSRRHEMRRMGMPSRQLFIDLGGRTLRFGDGLSAQEQEWLRDAINEQVRKARELH